MEHYNENQHRNDELDAYEYLEEEGVFDCIFRSRRMTKYDDLLCFFDFEDSRKIIAIAWKDNAYFKLDQIPLGSRLRLEYKRAGSGRVYLRNVQVLNIYNEWPDSL